MTSEDIKHQLIIVQLEMLTLLQQQPSVQNQTVVHTHPRKCSNCSSHSPQKVFKLQVTFIQKGFQIAGHIHPKKCWNCSPHLPTKKVFKMQLTLTQQSVQIATNTCTIKCSNCSSHYTRKCSNCGSHSPKKVFKLRLTLFLFSETDLWLPGFPPSLLTQHCPVTMSGSHLLTVTLSVSQCLYHTHTVSVTLTVPQCQCHTHTVSATVSVSGFIQV